MNNDLNNKINFDPMTGNPFNDEINSQNNINSETHDKMNSNSQFNGGLDVQTRNQQKNSNLDEIQIQMDSIPNVEQNKQEFINNSQTDIIKNKEENKGTNGILFLIISVAILLLAIYFLFPILLNYI